VNARPAPVKRHPPSNEYSFSCRFQYGQSWPVGPPVVHRVPDAARPEDARELVAGPRVLEGAVARHEADVVLGQLLEYQGSERLAM